MISETMHPVEEQGFAIDAVPNPAAAYTDYYDGEEGRAGIPTDKDVVDKELSTNTVKDSSTVPVVETNDGMEPVEPAVALPPPQDAEPSVTDDKDSDVEFSSSSSSSSSSEDSS